jgi:hypothetical protein
MVMSLCEAKIGYMGYPYQVLAFQKYSVLSPASEESVYASRKGKKHWRRQ